MLNDAVRHLSNALVRKAFRRWRDATGELQGARRALKAAAHFMLKRAMITAW